MKLFDSVFFSPLGNFAEVTAIQRAELLQQAHTDETPTFNREFYVREGKIQPLH